MKPDWVILEARIKTVKIIILFIFISVSLNVAIRKRYYSLGITPDVFSRTQSSFCGLGMYKNWLEFLCAANTKMNVKPASREKKQIDKS